MTDDKLSALWREADKGRELPEPDAWRTRVGPWADISTDEAYTANQMRAFAVPTPEALRRFAEAVAEECAKVCLDDAAGCQRAAEMMVDDEECARFDAMADVLLEAAAAIRRHVKGER